MKRQIAYVLFTLLMCVAATPAAAQVPTITVLGVGEVAFDYPLPVAEAAALKVRAYVGTRAGEVVTHTCVANATTSTCAFPIAALKLVVGAAPIALALTVAVIGVDGEAESEKGIAPFVLRQVAPPVVPALASFKVRPKP